VTAYWWNKLNIYSTNTVYIMTQILCHYIHNILLLHCWAGWRIIILQYSIKYVIWTPFMFFLVSDFWPCDIVNHQSVFETKMCKHLKSVHIRHPCFRIMNNSPPPPPPKKRKKLSRRKKGKKPLGQQQRRIPLPGWTEAIDVMGTEGIITE